MGSSRPREVQNGKLNYLNLTCSDISFDVSVVSQFFNAPNEGNWDVVIHILKYIKGEPQKGLLYEEKGHTQRNILSISGYYIFVDNNLISCKS